MIGLHRIENTSHTKVAVSLHVYIPPYSECQGFDEKTGKSYFGKTLTTPDSLIEGIVTGVAKAGPTIAQTRLFLHGTTVAINTILERTGARTALVTTRGFRDIYEIGRINRPDAYNLFFTKHEPLIQRAWRYEVTERMSARGEVLIALADDELETIARQLREENAEAVAILFLHSYANPAHEFHAKRRLQELCPGMFITASHEISQEYREFERTSTVAANAYIGPRVRDYLAEIDDRLAQEHFNGTFYVVQSSGGLYDVASAQSECIRMLESGPAAGVIGTQAVCERLGLANAIAFDMGGTTAKAGVVHDGQVVMAGNIMIGGYNNGLPIQIPLIDIQEVGTGGGSLARVETGGGLRVGPQSAGAVPGPACYARGGTLPTVTDANLVLGRLSASRFLGGEMPLDVERARRALATHVAEPLGIDILAAADGIIRIAATTMSHVVTRVTTERGLDAGDFTMVGYGGAGPLHASLVARELRMPKLIIPPSPGHFSAYGMLMADLRRDFVKTWFRPLATLEIADMDHIYAAMEDEGRASLQDQVPDGAALVTRRAADMRYVGQEHSVAVELPARLFAERDVAGIKKHFDAIHARRYGFSTASAPAEIVSLHASVIGPLPKPESIRIRATGGAPPTEIRPVYFSEAGGFVDTPVVQRSALAAGDAMDGPVLVEEHASTTVVLPGDRLQVSPWGDLVIEIGNQ